VSMARIAVVTGANQGLGLAVVKGLAAAWGPDDVVYLTGRDAARVEAAAGELRRPAAGARARVVPEVLDVTDDGTVGGLAERLGQRHGGVDVVVSNAAARLTPERSQADQVRAFVDTNNLGTTRMLRAFGPLLRPGGRYVVVASAFGTLRGLPEHLHARFATDAMTLEQVDDVMLAYANAVEEGRAAAEGWPEWINVASKVGQVAAMRVYARQTGTEGDAFVVAACPGLVDTAASRPWFADMSTARTPDEAAAALVKLALDPDPAWRGELVQFGRVLPWT
jgi:carbonyl reductase 1